MITITENNGSLEVTGKTYDVKEQLKNLGARWDSKVKCWLLPSSILERISKDEIIAGLKGALKEKAAEAAEERRIQKSNRVRTAFAARQAGDYRYHWICCEKAEVIDWGRKVTCCRDCGSDGYSVRICGRLYIGD
jgi:hypothetical protein